MKECGNKNGSKIKYGSETHITGIVSMTLLYDNDSGVDGDGIKPQFPKYQTPSTKNNKIDDSKKSTTNTSEEVSIIDKESKNATKQERSALADANYEGCIESLEMSK